jgi:exodeoxyribonuclease VII small subunit
MTEKSFEQAYQELETIVQRLETATLPLAEMLALYQQGMALAKQCDQQLEQAELSVKLLLESGNLTELADL